jgi:hypothetical protein
MNDSYQNKYKIWKRKYLDLKEDSFGRLDRLGKDTPSFIIQNTFPVIKNINRDNVKILDDDIRKMAGNEGTRMISDIIEERLGSNIIFTNITPNIGSDLINFTFRFQNINTVDDRKNKRVSEILNHNINLYDLTIRINKYEDSILNILKDRKIIHDVVYIDGFFLKNKDGKIYVNKYEISELVEMFKEKTKMFAFRLPTDYNFNKMFETIGAYHSEVFAYKKDKVSKNITFYLVTVMTNQFNK